MIVALCLPLKVATIILGCIFSMLFRVFRACSPISLHAPPIMALTEFFHADAMASIHSLPESWYLISSLCVYLYSWMHIMSMLWSISDAVSSSSCPNLFKVLTLNVTICIVCVHFSNFCLSSVAYFSNTEARAPISAGCTPFLPMQRVMRFGHVVWVWVMVIFQWLFLISSIEVTLINEQQLSSLEYFFMLFSILIGILFYINLGFWVLISPIVLASLIRFNSNLELQ